ncbi:hypothetical protein MKX03_012685, partial [Papaver bracteatum]
MEFWGIEVKPEQSYKVHATKLNVLHLSQACLGEVMEEEEEEEAEAVYVYVKVNDQKFVIGKLSSDKCPQIPLDLVFDKDLELSHSSEDGSLACSLRKLLLARVLTRMAVHSDAYDSSDEEEPTPPPM